MYDLSKLQRNIVLSEEIEIEEELGFFQPEIIILLLVILILFIGLFYLKINKTRNLSTQIRNPFIDKMSRLSVRERQVLDEILQNQSLKEIAETLFIEVSTVKSHANKIYKVFGVKNKRELLSKLIIDDM
ncbi:helix-turn-helix transcriptional regulator [Aquimarina celericrescens]|uniref:Helix-turn-helix transcriptional regulator n=1 Tax=Aquimarina celericrescens TaxID=1964542 RepID=A0ABW5AVL1_9FLAO|nr:helix-turn-helix transcriptional regulator [Aquimarina celericrescens]